jgi:HD-like signal output (HDOD) protein
MQSITTPEVELLIRKIKVPPSPEILTNLTSALNKKELHLGEIAEMIQKDAGISGLVIKTVNSPLFGLRNKVGSIHQAVSLLGINSTVNIVMGLVLRQTFETRSENLPRYWESPSNIALISTSLARKLLPGHADEAYLLGLFHNSGHALIQKRQSDYLTLYTQYINHPDHCITYFEGEQYGFDHAVLGYYLANTWNVPKHLQQIVLHHHNVSEFIDADLKVENEDTLKTLMAILKISEHLENLHSGDNIDHEWIRVKQTVLEYLCLSELDFDDLKADILEQLEHELD